MFPPAAVFQSATPADRTSHRSSLGVVRARSARVCVLVWQDAPRKACARAGVARRAAKKKKKKKEVPAKEGQRTEVQDKNKKESCARAAGLGSTMAVASLCVRSGLSNASPVQGARGTAPLCGGGNCRRVRVRCVVPAMMTCGNVTAGTRARASRSGRVCGGVWQCERRWPVAPS